jgi:hypothetical protein
MMIDILKKRINAMSIEPNIDSNVTTVTIHLVPIEGRDKENLTYKTQQSIQSTEIVSTKPRERERERERERNR